MTELSEKELELLAETLVNSNQINPEIQTPCKSVFRFISWGFFFLCFNITLFSFDFFPYFSLIGGSFLVFGFWHFANKNIYFKKVWKISIFILAARILTILCASTSVLYQIASFFTIPLSILVFIAFYLLFQNFELGLKEDNIVLKENVLKKLKDYTLVLLILPAIGTFLQNSVFEFLLFICYVIILILLIHTILSLGDAMDKLCYIIDRRNPLEIRNLKLILCNICIFSAVCMFALMLIPTQKHEVLSKKTAVESQLNSRDEFQEIITELPDSELQYYKKPIKNIQVQTREDKEMICTTYITEFEPENAITQVRYLYRLQYKDTSVFHRFHTNGYIAVANGDFPQNLPETINVFYSENGQTYHSDITESNPPGFSGGEVPERNPNTTYYFGITQDSKSELPPNCNAIYYFKGRFPYAYPYKPASKVPKIGPNTSHCFYVLYNPDMEHFKKDGKH